MIELPTLLQRKATRLLDELIVKTANDKYRPRILRYDMDGRQIYLYEVRRVAGDKDSHKELPMAQFRYIPELNQWTLHQKKGEYWQLHLNAPPTLEFGRLVSALQQDMTGCFWQD